MAPNTAPYNTALTAVEATVAQKERLLTDVDHMHMRRHGELFLERYAALPWTERREGGQGAGPGVVQFMRSTGSDHHHGDEAVATKVFLSRCAFHTELAMHMELYQVAMHMELYQVAVLRSMKPEVRVDLKNADGADRNSRVHPWPPCIVLEKGESLQEWKSKTEPAFRTIVDMR